MDNLLFGLAMTVLWALLGVGALLGWVAFYRSREARRRISRLESDLNELRSSVATRDHVPAAAKSNSEAAVGWSAAAAATSTPAQPPPPPPAPAPAAQLRSTQQASPPAHKPSAAVPAPPGSDVAGDWSSTAPIQLPAQPPPPAPARAAHKPAFDLERWIGVRGAAVLGGVFLIIAGFLFLQYSIERGWVTPEVRLTVGALSGVACIVVGLVLRKRDYRVLANSLTGAGIVLLYAVSWAAHVVYGRIEFLSAFGSMVAVTTFCAWLSYRHASQLIAVLGFVGGFATPLALSTGQDRPLGLFGYALLLDLGFLFVAHKRRWPSIAMLGVLGSFLLQGLWVFAHMSLRTLPIGLCALGVFGLMFAVFVAGQPNAERRRWIPAQASALLLPFLFVAYFAQAAELGWHIGPLAALAVVMTIAAGVVARLQNAPYLALGAAAGSLALVLVWSGSNLTELDLGRSWELAISMLVLSAIPHGFAELAQRRSPQSSAATAPATISALGFLLLCAYPAPMVKDVDLWPWLAVWVPLGLLLLRQFALGMHFSLALAGGLLSGLGLAVWTAEGSHRALLPTAGLFFALLIGIGCLWLFAARWFEAPRRPWAHWAAGLFLGMGLVAASNFSRALHMPLGPYLLTTLVLGALLALAGSAGPSAILFGVAVVATFAAQVAGGRVDVSAIAATPQFTQICALFAATAGLFTLWPFLAGARLKTLPGLWRVAAVASLPWFMLVDDLMVERHGAGLRFATALGFALFVGVLALRLWTRGEPEVDASERAKLEPGSLHAREVSTLSGARAWFGAAALFYAAVCLPLHLDRQPLGLGLALFGLGLAWLWTRSDHRALKYLCVAVLAWATLELAVVHALDVLPRASRRIFNWNAYLLLLPACCAGVAAAWLRSREVVRLRGLESQVFGPRRAICAAAAAICCMLLAFAWLNLEVADAFGTGETFRWMLRGEPQPSLALSIAWALYALLLLILGVRGALGGVRWASLALFVLTIAKVFLLDLAHLEGLYRVASMLGLALSLLVVSFLYQRFVFRRARAAVESTASDLPSAP